MRHAIARLADLSRAPLLALGAIALATSALAQTAVGGSRVTDLPPASLPLSGSEAVNVVQGGVSKQTTVGQIEGNIFAPTCSNPGFLYNPGVGPLTCVPLVNLSTQITGILPIPNGGTGLSALGAGVDTAFTFPTNGVNGLVTVGSALTSPHCLSVSAAGGLADQGTICNYSGSGSNVTPGEAVYVSPTYCPYADLTGAIDTTVCVQAAITAACSSADSVTGIAPGKLVFSRGSYYLKGVTIPEACAGLILEGQGPGNRGYNASAGTYIVSDNNCTGPIFNFYSDATANYVYGGGVTEMAFANNPAGGAQDGSVSCRYPLIEASYAENMAFTYLYAWQPYQWIKLVGGQHNTLNTLLFDIAVQTSPGVFEFTGLGTIASGSQAQRQDQTSVYNVFGGSGTVASGNGPFTGIWWHGFSNTLNIENVSFEGPAAALKIDCTGGGATDISACPAFLQASNFQAEGGDRGISNLVDAQDFQVLRFVDSYFHCFSTTVGKCNDAMKFYNNTFAKSGSVQIKGGQADDSQHVGIEAEIQGLNVSGMNLFNNNLGGSGGADIIVDSPVGSDLHGQVNIVNNQFCLVLGNTFSENAIVFNSGNDYLIAALNNFQGCSSGVTDNSGGTHNIVSPNAGP